MCIHIGSTVVLFISSQYMILVSETLDCLVFLDIYEMPIFVDIYVMFNFFRYILDVEFCGHICDV